MAGRNAGALGCVMKIKIEFEYLPDRDPCFWAKSDVEVKGETICVCTAGFSWNEARRRHLDKLQRFAAYQSLIVPNPEEVEV